MLELLLDTDTCIHVIRDRRTALGPRFQSHIDKLCISTIVEYELRFGAENSGRPDYHHEKVGHFVTRLQVLDFDEGAARHAASIKADLQRRGQLIGPNDLQIAGHARSRGLKLITGNLREFTRVEGLRCEDWL